MTTARTFRLLPLLLALPAALLLLGLPASETVAAKEPRVLDWADLVPEETRMPPPLFPGAVNPDAAPEPEDEEPPPYISMYNFSVNDDLNDTYVKLPGFIVPLESDEGGWIDEFLLVPYYGACIHVPPPPPNQLVYVKLEKPFYLRSMYDPFWVTGQMTTKRWYGDFAEAHYLMDGDKLELFEW